MNKQTTAQKLNIYINTARVNECFNFQGSNEVEYKQIVELNKTLETLKKKGANKPVFTSIKPKKPLATDTESVKSAFVIAEQEYATKKLEFDNLMKDFDKYSSEEFKRATLAYKMTTKLTKLVTLLEKDLTAEPLESRKTEIAKYFEQLRTSGLKKPIIVETVENGKKKLTITGQEITLKYSDLYPIPQEIEDLKILNARVALEYKATNAIFESKTNLSKSCLKFSKNVEFAISLFLQESIANLLSLAIKDCAKSGKSTISVNNFKHSVLSDSPFYQLYANLDAAKCLKAYIQRFDEYEKAKAVHAKRSKLPIKSFIENEKSKKHMKEVDGKKHWVGLNTTAGHINFVTYVGKIFDVVKADLKLKNSAHQRISSRAKEFVSNLMVQFLKSLAFRFDIYRTHVCKIEPTIKSKTEVKKREEVKSVKFETLVMIFEILLCSEDKDVKTVIDNVCSIKKRLVELKSKKN